ncbi:MAG: hypothetical protein ACI4C1_02830 [Lachnospiraceae bacterium]
MKSLCSKKWLQFFILFFIGGIIYCLIEWLWRGYSHFSMFFMGGICFFLCGSVNEGMGRRDMALGKQAFLCMILITFAELIAGIILNLWLKLDIWDYSNLPFNYKGQICLTYSLLWYLLSIPAICLDDWIRWKFFCGKQRKHHFF